MKYSLKTSFETLGLAPTATRTQVKERFNLLASIYHPNGVDGGEFPAMGPILDAFYILNAHFKAL